RAAGFARLADALFRQVDVRPAGEQVLQVPVALPVTDEYEFAELGAVSVVHGSLLFGVGWRRSSDGPRGHRWRHHRMSGSADERISGSADPVAPPLSMRTRVAGHPLRSRSPSRSATVSVAKSAPPVPRMSS